MNETPSQPPEPSKPDPFVKAVRGLTIAVWCLVVVFALQLGYSFFGLSRMLSRSFSPRSTSLPSANTSSTTSETTYSFPPVDTFEGKSFHELPVEKRIKYASVVLLTKHEKTPKRNREMITEIIKLKPGTDLHYKVGEEFAELSTPADRQCAGDGYLVFMIGSPAQFTESSSYTGQSVDGLGGLTLADLREEAKRGGK